MTTDGDSRIHSESGFDFNFKIELEEARRTFQKEEGFDDFGFGQIKYCQKSQEDVSSASKLSNKIKHDSALKSEGLKERDTPVKLNDLGDTQPYQPKEVYKHSLPPRKITSSSSNQQQPPSVDLNKQIQSYINNGRSLEYESSKLKDKQIQLMRAQETVNKQIEISSAEILQLNNKMSESLAYEESIQRILNITRGEKQNLTKQLQSITQQFFEPANDQEKMLLEQLEAIEQQFKRITQESGNLKLSLNGEDQVNFGLQSEINQNTLQTNMYTQLFNNISSLGGDWHKIIYNLKMSCLKPRWVLFENEDVQLGVVYDSPSYELVSCHVHVGNKTNKVIETIHIKTEAEEELLNGNNIKGNSFIDIQKLIDSPSFFYMNISYKVAGKQQVTQKLALPFGWMKFGDFQIITAAGFSKLWKEREGEISTENRPADTQIVSELQDFRKYFSNLVEISSFDRELVGLFKVERGEYRGTKLLCKFRYEMETYKIIIGKTKNTEEVRDQFLSHLSFLFSI